MGDLQEKNAKQTPKETENTLLDKKSIDSKIISEEVLERLHEVSESITSVQSTKIEDVTKTTQGNKGKGEENPVAIEEKPIPKKEQPAPKEDDQEKKDEGTEKSNANEANSERQNNTELTQEKQIISNSVVIGAKQPREKIIRNQSDIFSLKDISTTLQTSIFSVNGCPSRKLFRKQEPAGHLFQRNDDPPADKVAAPRGIRITKENYNDEKRPSSSYRNPLTGSGLSSNDEYKSKGTKRKDGNPLLGLGYDTEVVSSATSQHRIPPGGYSHKLW